MALKKYKIGSLIEIYSKKCGFENLTPEQVSGINSNKQFFEPAKQVGANTKDYKIVPPNYFACNLMHVGRDMVLPIALNTTNHNKIVSPAYTVFKLINEETVLKEFFFIFLNSKEKDRLFWFCTDSSVRDGLPWDIFCDVDIELPSIEIQKKYVAVYKAMVANQKAYEKGLDDLKLVCDAYIENQKSTNKVELGTLIQKRNEKNSDFKVKKLIGVGKNGFIEPKQSKDETNGHICYLIKTGDFCFAPPQIHQGSIDLYYGKETVKCSDAYAVFFVKDTNVLYPEYLKMVLTGKSFQHYAYYYRDGVREQFSYDQLSEMMISLPTIEEQKAIANIYKAYCIRKEINERLKTQIKDLCPILIAGAVQEAKKEV